MSKLMLLCHVYKLNLSTMSEPFGVAGMLFKFSEDKKEPCKQFCILLSEAELVGIQNIETFIVERVITGMDLDPSLLEHFLKKDAVTESINIDNILNRTHAVWREDFETGRLIVRIEEPLTSAEKDVLIRMWQNQGYYGPVEFGVIKKGDLFRND